MVEYEEYGGFKVISAVLPDIVPDSAAPLPPRDSVRGLQTLL